MLQQFIPAYVWYGFRSFADRAEIRLGIWGNNIRISGYDININLKHKFETVKGDKACSGLGNLQVFSAGKRLVLAIRSEWLIATLYSLRQRVPGLETYWWLLQKNT